MVHVLNVLVAVFFALAKGQGSIGCGGSVAGTVAQGGSVEYSFSIGSATKVTFTDCQSNFDPQMRVIDSSGTDITSQSTNSCDGDDCSDSSCSTSVRETIPFTSLAAGTYSVELNPYSSGGNYVIDAICSGACGRHRKAWNGNSITEAERNLYINGFSRLAEHGVGVIQSLSRAHQRSAQHSNHYFLPWHRAFVYELEEAFRGLGGDYACFSMPYWDWSHEATPSEVSGGQSVYAFNSGLGNDVNSGCVNDGSVFSQGRYDPARGTCLRREVGYTSDSWCAFSQPSSLMNLIDDNDDFASFATDLEGIPHSYPHLCVGGNMGTFYSPDDPFFYLHHSFVDYLWALWQDCNDYDGVIDTSRSDAFAGTVSSSLAFSPYTTRTYTVSQVLDLTAYDITYERGPFWSNAHVDAAGNCDHPINPAWFPTSRRRLIDDEKAAAEPERRLAADASATHERAKEIYAELQSQYTNQHELVRVWGIRVCEYEQEQAGRVCTPPDYFDDCSDMEVDPDTNDIDITFEELLAKEGLKECQKDIRRAFYQWASQFHSKKGLCAGCYDTFCDRSSLLCSTINHRDQDVDFSPGVIHHHLVKKPQPYQPYGAVPQQPADYSYIAISAVLMLLVLANVVVWLKLLTRNPNTNK